MYDTRWLAGGRLWFGSSIDSMFDSSSFSKEISRSHHVTHKSNYTMLLYSEEDDQLTKAM